MNIKIITLQRELNCNDKTENKWMYVKKLITIYTLSEDILDLHFA